MTKIVAFYSKDGNCKALAQVLADRYGCELFELEETKPRKDNFLGFMKCGYEAAFNKKSELKVDPKEKFHPYDEMVLVSPVWAGKLTPAVNTVLYKTDLKDKKVTLFACQADTDLKALKNIKTRFKQTLQNSGGVYSKCYCVQGASPGKEPFSYDRFKGFISVLFDK